MLPNPLPQQRRPALIPADADLNEEDMRSIKLRTGDVIVTSHTGPTKPTAFARDRLQDQGPKQILNENGKRKASTSAEDLQIHSLSEVIQVEETPFPPSENEKIPVNLDKDVAVCLD